MMIIKRIPVVLLCLIKTHRAAVSFRGLDVPVDTAPPEVTAPSIPQLGNQLSQMTFGDNIPEKRANVPDNTKPLLSPFEISEKMDKLIGTVSTLDTKTAVRMMEKGLVQILAFGACLHDIAPTIGSLPIDSEKLVLAAMENKAYTLLKLLQKAYIWRDEQQHHWFKALSYKNLWYDKAMWEDPEPVPLNWKRNLWAICKADSAALLALVKGEILQGDALESFDEKLLLLCIEHDAVKVFKSLKLDLNQLEEHLELLAKNSAAKLLQLYQNHKGIGHLHLEEYPFPSKLPVNVDDLEFLMANGYNFLSMKRLIEESCKKGRLDLLQYLNELNSRLVLDQQDLTLAAEGNFVDILDWGRQFKMHYHDSPDIITFASSLSNGRFKALYWWIKEDKIIVEKVYVSLIAESGALEVLQLIDTNQPGICNSPEAADSAAKKRHLPVLKWLYEKYEILPDVNYLGNATSEMLDWLKSKSLAVEGPQLEMRIKHIVIDYRYLVHCGASNFELLQWIFRNAPFSVLESRKAVLSNHIGSNEMLQWLYDKLEIHRPEMNWAFEKGDLEAIKWLAKKHYEFLTESNIKTAARNGHMHIITWVYEVVYPKFPSCLGIGVLDAAISTGNLEIAKYLIVNVFPETKVNMFADQYISADKHLAILKWAHEYGLGINQPEYRIRDAARDGDIQALEWIFLNLPTNNPASKVEWISLVENDQYKSYKWLLERYPRVRNQDQLTNDASKAYNCGSLGILRVLHEKHPSALKHLSWNYMTKANYHVYQWAIANGYPVEPFLLHF